MGLANCDLKGVWRKKKRDGEKGGRGLCLARRICDSLLSLQKMKSSVWHGACRQGDGSLHGKERARVRGRMEGGGERERERGDSVTHSVVSVCKLSRQRDHSADPRWISAREI